MRDFLRDFFNPPQLMKPKSSKKKIYKKRKKRTGPTPIQLQVGSLGLGGEQLGSSITTTSGTCPIIIVIYFLYC